MRLTLRRERPPFPPHCFSISHGAPTQWYSRKSSTALTLLAQKMESVWKTSNHSAGASSDSYTHDVVKNLDIISWLDVLMLDGMLVRSSLPDVM